MNEQQHIEEQLWSYIDGTSSAEERTAIEKVLAGNMEWRNKYHELLETHQLLKSAELEHPSMRFTKNVMEQIAKYHIAPATKSYINKKIVWGIGAFFITMILGFLIYGFGQIDWTTSGDTNFPVDFSKIDFGKFFNNTFVNVFMMINVVLGLVFLDRVLASKRKKIQNQP